MMHVRGVLFGFGLSAVGLLGACSSSTSTPPPSSGDGGALGHTTPPGSGDGGTSTGGGEAGTPPSRWMSVVGQGGLFAQTYDGASWASKTVGDRALYSVTCVGNLVGWTAGARGLVAHTVDGGGSWSTQDAHLAADLHVVRFGDVHLGVLAGDGGALALTHDGGTTWSAVDAHTTATLRGAAVAVDAGVLLVAGDAGTLVRSQDAGATWTTTRVPGAADFHGVASDPGAHVVLAVDSAGAIWSSADRGVTFAREASAVAALDAISIADDDPNEALAAGAHGTALQRSLGANGAVTWTPLATGTTTDLHAALVADDGVRLLAGEGGLLLTSRNAGASFAVQPLGTSAALFGLDDL